MADRLRGRTIVVTGGASGIGAALATGFAAEGANAVIADLNLEAADALVAEIRASGGSASAMRVDVTDRESVQPASPTPSSGTAGSTRTSTTPA